MEKQNKKQFTVWLRPEDIERFRIWSRTQKGSNGDLFVEAFELLKKERLKSEV